ncbi:unnamed protein product [Bemisia tabaci]|uniref:Uncharacterized protein n=1 Tax=Bemisia tabaci TaxID=7038 RepID=A0A9P0AJN4_BEMTA|nr:unnamed protein product [Bemisia tabaci]
MDIDIKNQIAAIENSRNLQELRTSVYDSPFIATLGVSIVKSFTHKRSIVRGALNLALNTRLQPTLAVTGGAGS